MNYFFAGQRQVAGAKEIGVQGHRPEIKFAAPTGPIAGKPKDGPFEVLIVANRRLGGGVARHINRLGQAHRRQPAIAPVQYGQPQLTANVQRIQVAANRKKNVVSIGRESGVGHVRRISNGKAPSRLPRATAFGRNHHPGQLAFRAFVTALLVEPVRGEKQRVTDYNRGKIAVRAIDLFP